MGKKKLTRGLQAPIILYEGKNTVADLEKLKKKHRIWEISDIYLSQLAELFEIKNPSLVSSKEYKQKRSEYIKEKSNGEKPFCGNWIYFPWNGNLVHSVNQKDYFAIRTNRNRNLITEGEQALLADSCVGIVGLSVGRSIALSLAYGGIAKALKLAEFDVLASSNLNRVDSGIQDIGKLKLESACQKLYEINPYIEITAFEQGLKNDSLEKFFKNGSRLNVVFDEIDDFEMKIRLRLMARREKIPVIMLTNLGDNVLVDIERYDLNPNLPLFNGLIGDVPEKIIGAPISEKDRIKYAVQIVGLLHVPTRALGSLFEIRKTLVGRPQLGSSVSVSGGLAAYLVRKLILGQKLSSGRSYISFDKLFGLGDDKGNNIGRDKLVEKFNSLLMDEHGF